MDVSLKGEVQNSILFRGVTVAKGAKLKNCVIMQDTCIGADCNLQNVITDKRCCDTRWTLFYGYRYLPCFHQQRQHCIDTK